MKYINRDLYNYLLELDNVSYLMSKNDYNELLELIMEDGLDNPISQKAIRMFQMIIEYRANNLGKLKYQELSHLLYCDTNYRRAIKNKDGVYVVYPILEELPTVNDLLMYYILTLRMDINEIIDNLRPVVENKKKELKNALLDTYYGDTKYLILRTKTIYEAIFLLSIRDDIWDKSLINQSLNEVSTVFNVMLSIVNLDNSPETFSKLEDCFFKIAINKEKYDRMRECYIQVLENEKRLLGISSNLWDAYAIQNNGVFIHQLTQGLVKSDQMDKICTSFYSNKANTITCYSGGDIGYVYPMDIRNTFSVCESDVGSWRVTHDEFIDRGLVAAWQMDETNIWYEYPHHSKLFSPEYIEGEVIKNGWFAEIIIDNRKKNVKPLYCFYTFTASEERIEQITRLALEQGLEVRLLRTSEDVKKADHHL